MKKTKKVAAFFVFFSEKDMKCRDFRYNKITYTRGGVFFS